MLTRTCLFICGVFLQLLTPWRMQDTVAKVFTLKIGDHEGTNISFNITKGSFGFMLKAAKKCWDNVFLEIVTRKGVDDLFAVFLAQVFITFTHYIKANAGVHECYFGFFMLGNTYGGVQCYGIPNQL